MLPARMTPHSPHSPLPWPVRGRAGCAPERGLESSSMWKTRVNRALEGLTGYHFERVDQVSEAGSPKTASAPEVTKPARTESDIASMESTKTGPALLRHYDAQGTETIRRV